MKWCNSALSMKWEHAAALVTCRITKTAKCVCVGRVKGESETGEQGKAFRELGIGFRAVTINYISNRVI